MSVRPIGALAEHEQFTIARRRAGVGQVLLAGVVGIIQPRLSQWERGSGDLPPEVIERLWAALEQFAAATAERVSA